MDALRFDLLVRTFASTRREALRHMAALSLGQSVSLAPLIAATGEAARRRQDRQRDQVQSDKKRKKKKCAKSGQPISKKRKRCCKGLAKDATGRCSSPQCPTCPANQLCMPSGVCQPCSVTCLSGDPDICGEDLQRAMNEGGEITVCPGRYRGTFGISANASVIGAGDGAAVGANTILQGADGRVVAIGEGIIATLRSVRITGGSNNAGIFNQGHLTLTDSTVTENAGGGIRNTGDSTLVITGCAITANMAGGIFNEGVCTVESSSITRNVVTGAGTFAGGILNDGGLYFNAQMTLSNTTIADNSADLGGGIANMEKLTLNSCTLERNNAGSQGGGLLNWSGETTLNDSNVTQNTAPDGGGIFVRVGTVTMNGTAVNENTVNNCAPPDTVAGCSA